MKMTLVTAGLIAAAMLSTCHADFSVPNEVESELFADIQGVTQCDATAETKAAACKVFNANKIACDAAKLSNCKFCSTGCHYAGSNCQGIVFKFDYKKDACPIPPKGVAASGGAAVAAAAAAAAKKAADAVAATAKKPGLCDAAAEKKAAACKVFNANKAACNADKLSNCKFCSTGCHYAGSNCQGIIFKFQYKKDACPIPPKGVAAAAKKAAAAVGAATKKAAAAVGAATKKAAAAVATNLVHTIKITIKKGTDSAKLLTKLAAALVSTRSS
jgi:hypothetical protein